MSFSHPFWLLFALPVGVLFWVWRTQRRSLNLWRTALLIFLFLALAGWSFRWKRPGGMLCVIVDRSASLPENAQSEQREIIARLQAEMKPEHRLRVISFGEKAMMEETSEKGGFSGFKAVVGEDQSRLSQAIDLALSLLPEGEKGRILVLSDGHWTGRDPIDSAQRAALRNVPLDYRLIQRKTKKDLSIHSVSAPQSIAKGQSFLIHAWLNTPEEQEIEYLLKRNNQKIARGKKKLKRGLNRIVFRDRPTLAGAASYTLSIKGEHDDAILQNNQARFMVGVEGDLPILVLTQTPNGALGQLLNQSGMHVKMCDPKSFDWSVENLANFSGVVIENIAASDLGSRGMELLAAWVESSGRGLLVTGGKHAYGAGGYFKSALERILPVSMELRREHRKFSLAIAIVLDRSGSMGASVSGGKTKMDLANIGAVQVLDLLSERDELGVIAVDSAPHTILRLSAVEVCRPRRNDILQIESMGGGIYVYEGLLDASKMLVGSKAGTRHIILFADAADAEQPGKYKELLKNNQLANITVSVVALGSPSDCDAAFLRDVAKRGVGEIYFTQDAMEIPRIFAQDTFAVARSTFLEDPVSIKWTPLVSMIIGGRSFSTSPSLGGYNLCYLRNNAQCFALSTDEYTAPIVAAWQAGAGRVICYTGEVDGEYTGNIGQWDQFGAFLSGMVRWIAGKQTALPNGIFLTQKIINGVCRISLHLDPDRKTALFSGEPKVNILRGVMGQPPQTQTFSMQWKTANILEVDVPLSGKETLMASVLIHGFPPVSLPPVCLKYSPEYRSRNPKKGRVALEHLAAVGGGTERINVGAIWETLPSSWRWISFRPFLLLLCVFLFILEIIERRIGLFQLSSFGKIFSFKKESKKEKLPKHKAPRKKPQPSRKKTASSSSPVLPSSEKAQSPLKTARTRAKNRFRR